MCLLQLHESQPTDAADDRNRRKQRKEVWKGKGAVIDQVNELIDELDDIANNIALQAGTPCLCVSGGLFKTQRSAFLQLRLLQYLPSVPGSLLHLQHCEQARSQNSRWLRRHQSTYMPTRSSSQRATHRRSSCS